MEQVRVLAVAKEKSISDLRALLDCTEINCLSAVEPNEHLIGSVINLPFDAAVMYSEYFDSEDEHFMEALYMSRKDIALILITDNPDKEQYEAAMKCGITRVFDSDNDPDVLCERVIEEIKRNESRLKKAIVSEFESKVVCFYSTKGGCGKTTCVVNTAVLLSRAGKRVAIADMDYPVGDVAACLNVSESLGIWDLCDEPLITPGTIKKYVKQCDYGISIIPTSLNVDETRKVDADKASTIISMLRGEYDYVIIDTPTTINDMTIKLMQQSEKVYLVVNPEYSSLKRTKSIRKILEDNELLSRCELLICRDGHSSVSSDNIKKVLGKSADLSIPYDIDAAVESINLGVPMVVQVPKSPASIAYCDFVSREFEIEMQQPRQKFSLFRKKEQ